MMREPSGDHLETIAEEHAITQPRTRPEIVRAEPTAVERARQIRAAALSACRAGEWKPCLAELGRAKELDPVGDAARDVQEARAGADRAIHPPPNPSKSPTPSALPTPPVKRAPPVKTIQKQEQTKLDAPKTYNAKKASKLDFDAESDFGPIQKK